MNTPPILVLPSSTNAMLALAFNEQLAASRGLPEVFLDFSRMQNIEPFGLLLITSAVASLRESGCRINTTSAPSRDQKSHEYLAHLGFWRELQVEHDIPIDPGSLTKNTVPITQLAYDELFHKAGRRDPIRAGIVTEFSGKLATAITKSVDPTALWLMLEYSFREMLRNVFEHSRSNTAWLIGHTWQKIGRVQIAILDRGCGLASSLARTRRCENDSEAIQFALQPGVSGKDTAHKRSMEETERLFEQFPEGDPRIYDNSGFGLTNTYELCRRAGTFGITSGRAWFSDGISGRFVQEAPHHQGTAVQIDISLPRVEQSMLEWKALSGNQRSFSGTRLLTASMITRLGLDKLRSENQI